MREVLTDTIIIRAGLEAQVAVALVAAGRVLAGAVPAERARPRALVQVAALAVAQRVARLALAPVQSSPPSPFILGHVTSDSLI